MKEDLKIFKIGGGIIDDTQQLNLFLTAFAKIQGHKILVHGGGKGATEMLKNLGIKPNMVDGRRVTDAQTLDIVTMFYAGKTNKQIVAYLQKQSINAIGLTGADANVIVATKRPVNKVDYGFVGDLGQNSIDSKMINNFLKLELTPVFCAINHDGNGQLLNTNADTIASSLAKALSKDYSVALHFCFDRNGVLRDVNDNDSVIPKIDIAMYEKLKADGIIADGMLPKLENAFESLAYGVDKVVLEHALNINKPIKTILCR